MNGDLEENPQNVNQDPYGRGWMIVVKPSDPEEIKGLLSRDDYLRQIQ
ncbi:hypothetical protein N752_07965 [Desulforamulus aquiferis]|nr:hypothetical protein N752_07965 [Desulforamulus aquiferis]